MRECRNSWMAASLSSGGNLCAAAAESQWLFEPQPGRADCQKSYKVPGADGKKRISSREPSMTGASQKRRVYERDTPTRHRERPCPSPLIRRRRLFGRHGQPPTSFEAAAADLCSRQHLRNVGRHGFSGRALFRTTRGRRQRAPITPGRPVGRDRLYRRTAWPPRAYLAPPPQQTGPRLDRIGHKALRTAC